MTFERIMGLHVVDDEEYQKYREGMEPILNSIGGSFGYDFKIADVLRSKTEGIINRVFTIEFPSKKEMDDFFSRADYLKIQEKHFKNSVKSKTLISMHEKNTSSCRSGFLSMKYTLSIFLGFLLLMSGCSDTSIVYESSSDLEAPYTIKLHEVKVVSETEDSLTLDFIYTYEHEVPAKEIKLYIMPDHGYWSTNSVKISRGKHGARVIIGLSSSNMKKDNITESDTTKLRFRFDHYQPKKYLGNVWGQDIEFNKKWRKSA